MVGGDVAAKSLFVSYSSADRFARDVIQRLKAQPLSSWDFRSSDVGKRLPIGGSVDDACREFVKTAAGLALIATEASLRSPFVRGEVETALALGLEFRIIVLLDERLGPEGLQGPFEALKKRRYVTVAFNRLESIERAVADVCVEFRVQHVGPVSQDRSFPFMDRLYEELKNVGAFNSEHESSTYYALMRLAERVVGTFERGEYKQASHTSQYLLAMCEQEFPGNSIYYARIMAALCEHALGRSRHALSCLLEIEKNLSQLGAVPEKSLHTAIAKVHYDTWEFARAAERYARAIQIKNEHVTDHCSLLLARLKAHRLDIVSGKTTSSFAFNVDQSIEDIERRASEEDRDVVDFAKAVIYRERGRLTEADAVFASMLKRADPAPEEVQTESRVSRVPYSQICYEYAEVLIRANRPEEAQNVLERGFRTSKDDPLLLMKLANVHLMAGQQTRARDLFCEVGRLGAENLAAGFTALRGLIELGQLRDAEAVACSMLPPQGRLPDSRDDFFFTAAANCVLGKPQHARYDFERSGQLDEQWLRLAEQRRSRLRV